MLLAMTQNCKMTFPGGDTPIRKVILQDANISKKIQEKLDCLLEKFEDIMLSR